MSRFADENLRRKEMTRKFSDLTRHALRGMWCDVFAKGHDETVIAGVLLQVVERFALPVEGNLDLDELCGL